MSPENFGIQGIAWGVIGVALVILLLGALGLVNISLVTVRFRVREIGIRRSYGATGARIFVGVLMESVVATVVAGAIGVTCAVALVKAPFVTDAFAHQKVIGLGGDTQPLLRAAGLADKLDDACLPVDKPAATKEFLARIAGPRSWDRDLTA